MTAKTRNRAQASKRFRLKLLDPEISRGETGQQFGNGFLDDGVNEVGRDFGQGREDKAPLMQPGMGDFQTRLLDDFLTEEEQVQVDHPGPPALFSDAAHVLLDFQKESEQLPGAHVAFERKHGVDEGRLLDGTHRLCAVEGRGAEKFYARAFLQRILRLPNLANRFAEVGARADESARFIAQKPAFSILSSASLSLASGTVRAKRIYPSPEGPKPFPGVVTTPQFLRTCAVNSLEVKPSGHRTQT